MEKIKILIVDDEPQARIALNGILSEDSFSDIEIVGEARDIPEAVKNINALKPDLVLLDVEMPGYSGLELLKFFNTAEISFQIIFVTAYSEYAINAFELSAIDYLLKPVQPNLLRKAINKLTLKNSSNKEELKALKENYIDPDKPKIALQVSEGLMIIQLQDIMYLKADSSYTNIYLSNGKRLTVTKKLIEYEKLERYPQFIRIHRSHIVNMERVKMYLKQDNGIIVMENDEQLSVSRDKKQIVLDCWNGIKL